MEFALPSIKQLLSPRENIGGNIVMQPFVCGLASARLSASMRLLRFALWARYTLQILSDHFQTSHLRCL